MHRNDFKKSLNPNMTLKKSCVLYAKNTLFKKNPKLEKYIV